MCVKKSQETVNQDAILPTIAPRGGSRHFSLRCEKSLPSRRQPPGKHTRARRGDARREREREEAVVKHQVRFSNPVCQKSGFPLRR